MAILTHACMHASRDLGPPACKQVVKLVQSQLICTPENLKAHSVSSSSIVYTHTSTLPLTVKTRKEGNEWSLSRVLNWRRRINKAETRNYTSAHWIICSSTNSPTMESIGITVILSLCLCRCQWGDWRISDRQQCTGARHVHVQTCEMILRKRTCYSWW